MQHTQGMIRGLWTLSHPQELLFHSFPFVLHGSVLNCTGNITLGKERRKIICSLGCSSLDTPLTVSCAYRNVQRANTILRHSSNVCLLGKTMYQKAEVCDEYPTILSHP